MSIEKDINNLIKDTKKEGILESNSISDGYHTFGELYAHRTALYVKLCKLIYETNKLPVWRSVHNDMGHMEKGWFILGVSKTHQCIITYHVPIEYWDETHFAETLDRALFDGHTSSDVLARLSSQL